MPSFILTTLAEEDLEVIGLYTQEKWGIEQRNKYLDQLDNRFQFLADNHNIGASRDELLEGCRSFPEGKHAIYYSSNETDIEILRIAHQSEDIERHFSEIA
jgi:toxin ParE1/3/4